MAMGAAAAVAGGASMLSDDASAKETSDSPADSAAASATYDTWKSLHKAALDKIEGARSDIQAKAFTGATQEELFVQMEDYPSYETEVNPSEKAPAIKEPEGDLTLSDGTVIPKVYVKLRNKINRIGKGVGSIPDEGSFSLLTTLLSEDEAAEMLEMPTHGFFTAYDYACLTDRNVGECSDVLEDLAHRCLIYRVVRAGVTQYALIPHINGMWEFTELKTFFDNGGDPADPDGEQSKPALEATKPMNPKALMSSDARAFDALLPTLHSFPISKDVIAEDEFQPYMDWRKVIEDNTEITVSPCQCRLMYKAAGVTDEQHPFETCLSLGEMAEYFAETGIGRKISQDEAIDIVENAIDMGMIPEAIAAKNADIMCVCHSECCVNTGSLRALGGGNLAWKNWNAYVLDYDKDICIQCGACIERCPMKAISFGDDGYCIHDATCVRCGQCVSVCPVGARILKARSSYPSISDYPEYPFDYVSNAEEVAEDMALRGFTIDFTDSKIDQQ